MISGVGSEGSRLSCASVPLALLDGSDHLHEQALLEPKR
jgi:hypothetical protein